MSAAAAYQGAAFLAVLLVLAWPLGLYMARVYAGEPCGLDKILAPLERGLYRICGIRPDQEMGWRTYALACLVFNLAGIAVVYALQRLQGFLPLNPHGLGAVAPDLALNTALSFGTNTNWQAYGGETTLSYLTQMLGLTVQNFLSAATGLAVFAAVCRSFVRRETRHLGNFWADTTRGTLYVLLPLSLLLALALVSQGVVQTFDGPARAKLLEPVTVTSAAGAAETVGEQVIARGPAASQVSIKQLGTNGGGFFNVNSAHPLENPTPLSNFLECLAILLLPAACCFAFGRMVRDRRQGLALLAAMVLLFVLFLVPCIMAEEAGNPLLSGLSGDMASGNLEGKELRFGVAGSALWAVVTTAASNGSVNSMHDSFTPLGGLVPMVLMQLGEVVFGGAGSGLYGMLAFALVAVFVAGLMVGRTPEYLGKKIGAFEMQMAGLVLLTPVACVLLGAAAAVSSPEAAAAVANPGPHGFSEILYAFSSMGNNNGSAFAGLSANQPLYNLLGGLAMFASRYWIIVPMLALAGSLAAKKAVPAGPGTLPTHGPLFIGLLAGSVLVVGALSFFPALALGPIVEHLQFIGR
ncbi:MAG: potassium-transporting ATPase subunit KdpA [Desulfovibrionaceae bacterium]|nr:potassium-transporting ATPase subunit KdpA [Desulfovibrionaceae bacterium]